MPDRAQTTKRFLRIMPLLGFGLLGYLLTTIKLHDLVANARAIGWGMLLVIALGGFSHIVKTWAWRLTLQDEASKVRFGRTLALRLISEAIGQFGFVGMVGGEAARVSLLGSEVSTAGAISSVALDRTLFIVVGALVTIAGIISLFFAVSMSHAAHFCAVALVLALLCPLLVGAIAMRRKWPVFSGPARAAARIPWLRTWLLNKESTLKESERRVIHFYHRAPKAFWLSVLLNLFCHFLAIVEVYLIVRMLGAPASLLAGLILESLTKVINVIGAVNPGNVGTYEAGNMMVGQFVRLTRNQGLLLALCRRVRALFWAIIGGICLVCLSRRKRDAAKTDCKGPISEAMTTDLSRQSLLLCETAFILVHDVPRDDQFEPTLARVATLPLLLRTILGVQGKERVRTIVVARPGCGSRMRRELLTTGRLPKDIEWMEIPAGAALSSILGAAGLNGGRVAFVLGDRTYHPNLLRRVHEWNGEGGAIELVSSGKPIGLVALAPDVAARLATETRSIVVNEMDLHDWIAKNADFHDSSQSPYTEVDEASWQRITCPADLVDAEKKLDRWLVKSTDGLFARMNRSFSIPISRQLIKFPITPNMVSLFTLGLSLVSGACFAAGGYRNSLVGAMLGVWTSILDGCDGEVARLKLQASNFGCWLDTICDYLYYITTFAGITVGLTRSTGDPRFMGWCLAIFGGAFLTFITASVGRKRHSGKHPEQYLAVWQKKAENRSAGVLVNFGRYTEFIVRRCFLPYLLLALAILNLMPVFFYMAAIGANVAWIISLCSLITFSSGDNARLGEAASTRSNVSALVTRSSDSSL